MCCVEEHAWKTLVESCAECCVENGWETHTICFLKKIGFPPIAEKVGGAKTHGFVHQMFRQGLLYALHVWKASL